MLKYSPFNVIIPSPVKKKPHTFFSGFWLWQTHSCYHIQGFLQIGFMSSEKIKVWDALELHWSGDIYIYILPHLSRLKKSSLLESLTISDQWRFNIWETLHHTGLEDNIRIDLLSPFFLSGSGMKVNSTGCWHSLLNSAERSSGVLDWSLHSYGNMSYETKDKPGR